MKRILVILAICGVATFMHPGAALASTSVTGSTHGYAEAGYLLIPAGSSVASVGPLFPVSSACGGIAGTQTASGASLALGTFASSGSLIDQIVTTRSSTSDTVQASSYVQNVNVLSGVIRATAVDAVAQSTGTATNATSTNASTFAGLTVAGRSIGATVAPNTRITLANLGYVVLNEQSGPYNSVNSTSIAVNAIDVYVTTANTLGLPIGARIIIAHANSSFTRTSSSSLLTAYSYGLYVQAAAGSGYASSGPYAFASIPCTGGSQAVSLTAVNVPLVASSGTIYDTASGSTTSTGGSTSSSSTVQQVSLLGGLIKASVVKATANASLSGTTGSATGTTSLGTATVAGLPVAVNPAANTKITLAGLGYVVLNEQSKSVSSTGALIYVNAIDVYITTANTFGLPVGSRIIVARAVAGVKSY